MTSLRKRVTSYFRQLSFHNEPRDRKPSINENSFINKYLLGQIKLREGPPVLYGKEPSDLPNFELDLYTTGSVTITGCATGPNGGLTSVKRVEKHLSIPDQDIDYIDTQDEIAEIKNKSPVGKRRPLDNTTMVIRVAGQEYRVSNRANRKSRSLGSLTDLTAEPAQTDTNLNNNDIGEQCKNHCEAGSAEIKSDKRIPEKCDKSYSLSKSKSESNPFEHKKKGKIIRLTERPKAHGSDANVDPASAEDSDLPKQWARKTEYVYGLSDSLYDVNQVTNCRNGNPIADCFGIIARTDSAILALADGVNWGEKASVAAKSAVHGCLHYLNKTIFEDTSVFDLEDTDQVSRKLSHESFCSRDIEKLTAYSLENNEVRISNTTEVFICLLRAFNCAHNLILENQGMLTTLTAAIVLPLKTTRRNDADNGNGARREKYVCCVCNVGDTLAYVYSQKHGVRELTKGSHDISCNRDMRDALGALGPVDGINPELNNLTLSVTILEAGDIVMIASDGLTDNYDPTVCKFTVNVENQKPQQRSGQPTSKEQRPSRSAPPRESRAPKCPSKPSKPAAKAKTTARASHSTEVQGRGKPDGMDDPLVAQFMLDNALGSGRNEGAMVPLSKSSSISAVGRARARAASDGPRRLLRSKTSVEIRPKAVARNEDGLPYVTPPQRYEITLLLIEDILRRGTSGRDAQCATARALCESLLGYTVSITAAKRRTLEDKELYFDLRNDVLVEVPQKESKARRRRCLDRIRNLPGKLDHVSVVACNIGNRAVDP